MGTCGCGDCVDGGIHSSIEAIRRSVNNQADDLDSPQKRLSGAKRRWLMKYEYHYTWHLKPAQNVYLRTARGKPSNPTALPFSVVFGQTEKDKRID
jgi:hypothetical protein